MHFNTTDEWGIDRLLLRLRGKFNSPTYGRFFLSLAIFANSLLVGLSNHSVPISTTLEISEFSFSPSTIDVTSDSQTVIFNIRIKDSVYDFVEAGVGFTTPRGESFPVAFRIADRISGDSRNGVYRKEVTVPRYAAPGTWIITGASTLVWNNNNEYFQNFFTTADLTSRGFNTQLQVLNTNETNPPEIGGFRMVRRGNQVAFEITARDDTGVDFILLNFSNPPGCWVYGDDPCINITYFVNSYHRVSGDARDGFYSFTEHDGLRGLYYVSVWGVDLPQNIGSSLESWFRIGRTTFDFDGDLKADFSSWRPSDQTWYIAESSSGQMVVRQWGLENDRIAPADYDGDGKTDMAVYRPSEGKWYVIYSATNNMDLIELGSEGDIPLPHDYDGDGWYDFGVWRPIDGTWHLRLSVTGSTVVQSWGLSGDKPVPADYNGDGRSELAVWRPSEGRWYMMNLADGNLGAVDWGLPGDVPITGDYSADGRADLTVYRPSNQTWYRMLTGGLQLPERRWGLPGDIPAPGDFDGDGMQDIAVWRPSEAKWYVMTAANTPMTQTFGFNGDIPAESAYVY